MRFAQLVMGPAGSGKSTYCSTMAKHAQVSNRVINIVNLDPAAEHFDYEPFVDIRELIHVDDAMEDPELKFGPNGGLVFCMKVLLENLDWLEEQLQDLDDDYIIFDLPGQIELYTHMPLMKQLVEALQSWNFRVCGVFLIDSHFMVDGGKFISGSLAALSVMVNLEIPHVNILSKVDLLSAGARKHLDRFLEPDMTLAAESRSGGGDRFHRLSECLGRVLDDYSLVKFFPLDIQDEENIGDLLVMIDNTIQFGEDADVKTHDFEYPDNEDE